MNNHPNHDDDDNVILLSDCNVDSLYLISSYLSAPDVSHVKQSCKDISISLKNIRIVNVQFKNKRHNKLLCTKGYWIAGRGPMGDKPRFWQRLPSLDDIVDSIVSIDGGSSCTICSAIRQRNIHSIRFEGTWRDQGWGNQKGRIVVVKHKTNASGTNKTKFVAANGTIVYQSPEVASHSEATFRFHLNVDPMSSSTSNFKYDYSICVIVGGGGGHELTIKGFKMSPALLVYKAR